MKDIYVYYLLVTVLTVSSLTVGFISGKYYERVEWNRLIKEGKIPAPTKSKDAK